MKVERWRKTGLPQIRWNVANPQNEDDVEGGSFYRKVTLTLANTGLAFMWEESPQAGKKTECYIPLYQWLHQCHPIGLLDNFHEAFLLSLPWENWLECINNSLGVHQWEVMTTNKQVTPFSLMRSDPNLPWIFWKLAGSEIIHIIEYSLVYISQIYTRSKMWLEMEGLWDHYPSPIEEEVISYGQFSSRIPVKGEKCLKFIFVGPTILTVTSHSIEQLGSEIRALWYIFSVILLAGAD